MGICAPDGSAACSCCACAERWPCTSRCWPLSADAALMAQTSRFLKAPAFACYKGLCFLYFLAWCLIWPALYSHTYLYLTYWAWYVGCLYFTVSFVTSAVFLQRQLVAAAQSSGGGDRVWGGAGPSWSTLVGDTAASLPSRETRTHLPAVDRVLVPVQLFTWNVSCVGSLVVFTVYWSALYNGARFDSVDLNAHSFFAVIMLVDQLLVASEFRLRDLWKSFVMALTYLVFNVTHYYLAPDEDKVIYHILDWGRHPWVAVAYTALCFFVLIPFFGVAHYALFRLRESMFKSCRQKAESSLEVLDDHLLGDAEDGSTRTDALLPGSLDDRREANGV